MDLKRVHAAVDAYVADAKPADAARLRFFEQIFDMQQHRSEELDQTQGVHYEPPVGSQAMALYRDPDHSVFASVPVKIEAAEFAKTCSEIAQVLASKAGLAQQTVAALNGIDWAAFAGKVDMALAGSEPAQFVEQVYEGADKLGIPTDLPTSVLISVLRLALRPHLQDPAQRVVEAYGEARKEAAVDADFSASLTCPVCGAPAALSWIGDSAGTDGRGRKQYCSLCGTQWDFERIRCSVCGTHNIGHLHYFSLEGDFGHRIQTCDECDGYQRVVFQEDLKHMPMVIEVEDVVMTNLDQIINDPHGQEELHETKLSIPAIDRPEGMV